MSLLFHASHGCPNQEPGLHTASLEALILKKAEAVEEFIVLFRNSLGVLS